MELDNKINVFLRRVNDTITIPKYATSGSACVDIESYCNDPVIIKPNEVKLIKTGLIVEIPKGYEGQIRTRSGLAYNNKLFVLNSPGTIDSDYRGEIGVLLMNIGDDEITINNKMRIAQLIITKYEEIKFIEKDMLTETVRNVGSFGSTGI